MGDLENNMDNAMTTSRLTRANRRTRGLPCRGRVSPRRLGLSKVVDVVSIGKKGRTLLYKFYCICLTVGCGMW